MKNAEIGASCPVTKTDESLFKKILLFFFRFGLCPACVIASVGYGIVNFFKSAFIKSNSN